MAAATKKQQQPAAGAGGPAVVDPKFEWAEKAGSYVLRLTLPGFRKDDFRVQVDSAGRLTVRGTRPAAAGPGSLHKVFQLPSTASLDDIAGRFEAGVLTLTVPKRASSAPAPASNEESAAKEEGATGGVKKGDAGAEKTTEAKEEIAKEDTLKKAMEEATNKAQAKKREEEEAIKSRKQEQQKQAPAPMKPEEVKPKEPQAAAAEPAPMKPAPKPEVATADKAKAKAAAVHETESLAERVRRRVEEERTKAAAAATAAMEAISEPEKKTTASWGGHWKERVEGELKVLTDMKWADSLVEAAKNNKEVVAVGIAAFSLGLLISHKLFRK